jgi:hypothetical protein
MNLQNILDIDGIFQSGFYVIGCDTLGKIRSFRVDSADHDVGIPHINS